MSGLVDDRYGDLIPASVLGLAVDRAEPQAETRRDADRDAFGRDEQ